MKKTVICMMLGAAALATSCVSENHSELEPSDTGKGTGVLTIDLKSDLSFANATRALEESDYHNTDNYQVKLIKVEDESVVFTCLASELGSHLPCNLPIGERYRVEAWYGTEHDASRDEFRVEGSDEFSVESEEQKKLTVECTPTCGKLTVAFDEAMATYYETYDVTYSGTEALGDKTITWAAEDTEPWYVALNEGGEDITYTINLTTKEEYAHVEGDQQTTTAKVTGKFNLQRNRAQKLTIRPSYKPGTAGVEILITIDDSTNDKEIDWEVPTEWIF